jgi:hypothetical protein
MPQIIRTVEDIDAARFRAQKAAFAAQDDDEFDDAAEAAYGVLQWILGNSDTDPTLEMAEED